MPRKATACWQIWVATELSSFVSRQGLVLGGCSWVAVVISLCRGNVMTKVPL